MNIEKKIRELAEDDQLDDAPLLEALESATRYADYWKWRKQAIAGVGPAEVQRQLVRAHKALEALPWQAKAHLHFTLAELLGRDLKLEPELFSQLMEKCNLFEDVLQALAIPVEEEAEDPLQLRRRLVCAWVRAGGEVRVDDRYDEGMIDFLIMVYHAMGEDFDVHDPASRDTIRLRLNRLNLT